VLVGIFSYLVFGMPCSSLWLWLCIMCTGYMYHVRWLRVSCALVTCIMCAGYVYHVRWLRVSCALVTRIMCAGYVYHVRWLRVSCALVACIMCAGYVYHVSWLRVSCALVTLDTMHALCGVCLGLARNHTFIGVYGVYTVFLAGESPYIWSYMVQIYGSGQPYVCHVQQSSACCWVCRVCVGTFVCLCMYHLTLGITVLHSFDISACL